MRFEYLRYFYKIAGIIDDVREIFKERYPNEPPGKVFNIAEQWRRKNNITEILDREALKASLPDNINDVLKNSEMQDLRKSLKLAGLPGESINLLNKEGLSWFKERYLDKTRKEIVHPILEALDPVLFCLANKDSIVNFLSNTEASDHLNINQSDVLLNLSLDDIVKLNNAFSSSKEGNQRQTSIDTTNVIPDEKEFIAKVGDWNVWLPHTQETSAKIAGYHPITKEPLTTWCTARTKGSNLYYNYAGKVDPSHFGYSRSSLDRDPDLYLYYIIKDNPMLNTDWLSIGVLNGGNKIQPIFNGKNGGVTIDRANIGLTKDNFYRIVGGEVADEILNIIIEKTKEYGENHPAIESIRELIKDTSKFKRALLTKGASGEAPRFAAKVLDLGEEIFQNKDVFSLCVEANPQYFFENIALKYKRKLTNDTIQIAIKSCTKKDFKYFFENIVHSYRRNLTDDAVQFAIKSCAEKDSKYFFENISEIYEDEVPDDVLQSALKSYAEMEPDLFFTVVVEKYGDKVPDNVLQVALKSCAEKKPHYFLGRLTTKYKDKISDDLYQVALKNCAKDEPRPLLDSIFYKLINNVPDDILQSALKSYAEQEPDYFFNDIVPRYKDKISDDVLQYALKSYAEEKPYHFLKYIVPNYKDKISYDIIEIARKLRTKNYNKRFAAVHSIPITASKIKVLRAYLIKSGFKKEAEELLKIM
jgi:hypothetical protein